MTNFPTNPLLDDDILQRREQLPRKPDAVTLHGRRICLQPLNLDAHIEQLFACSNGQALSVGSYQVEAYDADERIWRYMSGGPFANADELALWLQRQVDAPDGMPLCVIELETEHALGVVNLMSNAPVHLSIELGNIWYSPLVQGKGINTEASYLMLEHVFSLGYRRVVWKCDTLNTRSRQAAFRLGFQFEGIHKKHYIVKNRSRDTAWFCLLDDDWEDIRPSLRAILDEQ